MRVPCVWGIVVVLAAALAAPAAAQQKLSPTETVLAFYKLLREQNYMEGFGYSVYREAVEGLSEEDFAELVPDFQQTFSDIPEKIEIRGEQAGGDVATVFALFGPGDEVQEVSLVKVDGKWLVGDRDALEQVRRERTSFFFNARVRVNHNDAFDLVKRITGTEDVRFQTKKAYGTLDELVAQEGFAGEIKDGVASGYRFTVFVTPDRQAFTLVAVPVRYGRTGKLSFFSDGKSVHAADAAGRPVNEQAPVLVEDVFKNENAPQQ
jgi:hypothetical protein